MTGSLPKAFFSASVCDKIIAERIAAAAPPTPYRHMSEWVVRLGVYIMLAAFWDTEK